MEHHRIRRTIGIVGLVMLMAFVFLGSYLFILRFGDIAGNPQKIRGIVLGYGVWGYLVFALFNILQIIFAPVPGNVVTISSGILFGFVRGVLVTWASVVIGGSIVMVIARSFGRKMLELLLDEKARRFEGAITRKGLPFILLLSIFPNPVGDGLFYLAGLTTIPLKMLILIIAVGRLPGIVLSVFLGDTLLTAGTAGWILGGLGLLVVVLLYLAFGSHIEKLFEKIMRGRPLREKRDWLRLVIKDTKPGTTVEFGCGSGFVLEMLSRRFSANTIIGIDTSMERLEAARELDLKNVMLVSADFTGSVFKEKVFNTVVFVASLHEVFSSVGRHKVLDAFRQAFSILKDDGIVVVQDFLKPNKKEIEISFKNEKTRRKFFKFAREFRQRQIQFVEKEKRVQLDCADAVEFISKYRSPDEEDWQYEMNETHFFFTEDDYRECAAQTGFDIVTMQGLGKHADFWREISRDIVFDHPEAYQFAHIVLMKRDR